MVNPLGTPVPGRGINGRLGLLMDRWVGFIDGQMVGSIDGQMGGCLHERMNAWVFGWVDG